MNLFLVFFSFLIAVGFAVSVSGNNLAYGLWIPQSPEELMKQSETVFVGIIKSVNVTDIEHERKIEMEKEDGTYERITETVTISLDKYTVDVEEYLKNPQDTMTMTLLEATVGGVPSRPSSIGGFETGDRVLFYVPKIDGQNQYSPESFKIPKYCNAKQTSEQPRIGFINDFKILQEGITKNDNVFDAGKPIQFVYKKDLRNLDEQSFDFQIAVRKANETGKYDKIVLSEKIHAKSNPCEWIAIAKSEFVPQPGNYTLWVSTTKGDTESQNIFSGPDFSVHDNTSITKEQNTSLLLLSPLKQYRLGITIDEIQCQKSLIQVTKYDGSPACVKHETKLKLIERNWISVKPKINNLQVDENTTSLVSLWIRQVDEKISTINISDDSTMIAVGTKNDNDGTGKIYLFDSKGNQMWDRTFDRMISNIEMSSDGSYLVASGYHLSGSGGGGARTYQNGVVYFLDSDGNQLWNHSIEDNNISRSLFVHPDGSGVSFGTNNKIISLDKQGKIKWQADVKQYFDNVAYSHDGSFAVGSDSKLLYFDNTGEQLWSFTTKNNSNYATIISHDGKKIVTSDSSGTDGNIYYLDSDGNLLWEYHLDEAAQHFLMSQNDSYLVASNNLQFMLFDNNNTDTGDIQWINNIPSSHVQISSDGSFLVGITRNQITGTNITFFDKLGNIISNHPIEQYSRGIQSILSNDGQYVVVTGTQPRNDNNENNYSNLSFFEIKEDILNQDILYDLSEMQESSELHIEIVAPKDDDNSNDDNSFDVTIKKGNSLEIPWDVKLDGDDNYATANFGVSIESSSSDLQSWITPDKPYRTTNGIPPGERIITIHPTLNASSGNYTVQILGHGHSVHEKTGWMTNLEGKPLATIDVSVIPDDSSISIETGPVHYEKQSFCLVREPINNDGDGGGQFCQGGPTYQEMPITVFSDIPQIVHLDASVVQQERGWIKFVPEEIVAGPDGAKTNMIMAGFLVPFGSNPSAEKSMIISVHAENDYEGILTTTVIPVRYDDEISVINHGDDDNISNNDISNSIKLKKIRTSNNGANFGVTGVVYDPPAEKISKNNDDDNNTLSVTLSVLGMWNNDDETITELPEWLSVNIPEPSFVLDAYKPHHFMISAKTFNALPESVTYFVAINQTIGEQNFVELQEITIENRH